MVVLFCFEWNHEFISHNLVSKHRFKGVVFFFSGNIFIGCFEWNVENVSNSIWWMKWCAEKRWMIENLCYISVKCLEQNRWRIAVSWIRGTIGVRIICRIIRRIIGTTIIWWGICIRSRCWTCIISWSCSQRWISQRISDVRRVECARRWWWSWSGPGENNHASKQNLFNTKWNGKNNRKHINFTFKTLKSRSK